MLAVNEYLLNESRWLFVNSESVFLHACTVHPSIWKDVTTEDYLGGFGTLSAIRHAAKYTWANTEISCHVWEGTVTCALLTCCWHHTDTMWWPNTVSPANSYDLPHDKCLSAVSPKSFTGNHVSIFPCKKHRVKYSNENLALRCVKLCR